MIYNLVVGMCLSFLIIFDSVISYYGIVIKNSVKELNPFMVKVVNNLKLLIIQTLFMLVDLWIVYFFNSKDILFLIVFAIVSIIYSITQYNNIYQIFIKTSTSKKVR